MKGITESITEVERQSLLCVLADAEAMRNFIWNEMSWEDFRAEMFAQTSSEHNFRKLEAFLNRDGGGFSRRLVRAKEILRAS